MKAYICDRCGIAYTKNKTFPTVGRISGSYIAGMALLSFSGNIDKTFDLCDVCLEDLWDFLDNKTVNATLTEKVIAE